MQKCRAINPVLGSRTFVPTRVQFQAQRRFLQDVSITRTGKPLLKVQGGRYVPNCSAIWCIALTSFLIGHPSEVLYQAFMGSRPIAHELLGLTQIVIRTHRDRLWCHRFLGSLHCPQARYVRRSI